MLRFALAFGLAASLVAPALGQPLPAPSAQMNAYVAALCDGDPTCMAGVRQRLQAHCGQDRACMRDALQRAQERRDQQDPSLSDLPPALQTIVRTLLGLAHGTSAPQPVLGAAARAQLDSFNPNIQAWIRQRCGADEDCIRDAMEQVRDRQNENAARRAATEAGDELDPPRVIPEGIDSPSGRNPNGSSDAEEETSPEADSSPEDPDGEASSGGNSGGVRDFGDNPPGGSGSPATVGHDNVGTTFISGDSNTRTRELWAPDGAWLIAIRMAERSDDPCYVQAYYTTEDYVSGPNSFDPVTETYMVFDRCGENGPTALSRQFLAMGLDHTVPIVGGQPYAHTINGLPVAITGLQICQRSSNDLLKGLKMTGATLATGLTPMRVSPYLTTASRPATSTELSQGVPGPFFSTVEVERSFERPNCDLWQAERTCAAGKVAVGLNIHYDDNSAGRAQITGLALQCAELTR